MNKTARLIEIFPSIQGEGIYVGQPHLFLRFWNCNMACHYCDTDYKGPYTQYTQEQLSQEVAGFIHSNGPFHAVSLTGGEPLLWGGFLKSWLPALKSMNQNIYLETNGTLPKALEELLPWIDIVAMDLKPKTATADRSFWSQHETFLKTAHGAGKDLFVKVIVTAQTSGEEIRRCRDLVASVEKEIPFVLQPVTPWGKVTRSPSPEQLSAWRCVVGERLYDVRVVPQVHRMLGVR